MFFLPNAENFVSAAKKSRTLRAVSYQVFARKYRPQTFDDVVGQDHITRTLKNAIAQNRLAHAYLFVGPRGTGKTSTARILSKSLCCVKAPTTEPCGVCDACKEIAAGTSLDVLEIDGASNNGVEQVRELRDNVRYAPTHGKYKIYIIDEVHMLTSAAFNALLKTLEEPPEHVKFVFATTEPQKVLPTILSRCQRFDLRRIPAPLIAAHLQKIAANETIDLADNAADTIARGAEGGLRDAESMLDQLVAFCGETIGLDDVLGIFGFTAPETVSNLAGHIVSRQTGEALAVLDAQSEGGKDLLRLLSELIAHLRDLLVFQVNPEGAVAERPAAQLEAFREQAPLVSSERVLELIDGFGAAEGRMKWAPNKKLHFEIAIIKAIQGLGQSTLTEVIDALANIREAEPASDGKAAVRPLEARAEARSQTPPPSTSKVAESPARGMDWASLKRSVGQPANVTPPPPEKPKPVLTVASVAAPDVPAVKPPTPPPVEVVAPAADLDGPRLWRDMIQEIRSQRPLITAWVQMGRPLAVEGNTLRVGFPSEQKMSVESLNKANTRKFLEGLLSKLAGQPVGLKLELGEATEAASAVATPPANEQPPATGGSSNGRHEPGAAPAPALDPEASTDDTSEMFKNDPLIQKALKIFEGEIRSVQGPS